MRLTVGHPVETTGPTLVVDALPVGKHRIELVVVNRRGQRSRPVEVVVTITPARRPPA